MLKKTFYPLFTLLGLMLLTSCEKSNKNEANPSSLSAELTKSNRSWRVSAATLSPKYVVDGKETDNYYQEAMDPCQKDDYWTFTTDGKLEEYDGEMGCGGVALQQNLYTISSDQKTITVTRGASKEDYAVVSLSSGVVKLSTVIELEGEDGDFSKYTVTYTYSAITTPASSIPVLFTGVASEITQDGFKVAVDVKSEGKSSITAKGIVWSTLSSPTTDLSTKTNNGSGIGSFTALVTGLQSNRTYYVRSYVTNSEGTFYGSQITVKTLAPPLSALGLLLVDKNWKLTGFFENGVDRYNPMDCTSDDHTKFTSNYRYVTTDLGIRCFGSTGSESGTWSLDGTDFTWDGEIYKNLTVTATTMSYETTGFFVDKYIYTKQ